MNGYPAEEHVVTTDDGYMLTIHRIPGQDVNETKPPVFLGKNNGIRDDITI